MTYEQVLEQVHSLLKFGIRLGLERMSDLLCRIGDPQARLSYVHVAGTNGKGSTSTMIAGALIASGKKTGLFTSPYVIDFRERMQINGTMISKSDFVAVASEVLQAAGQMADQPTEFEVVTATALKWFADSGCEFAVLEVGLGGRYDSTNIIGTPLASVITPIAFDHMGVLGDTIQEIAFEKCGIIKPDGITIVSGGQTEAALAVIEETARTQNNHLILCSNSPRRTDAAHFTYLGKSYGVSMLGDHQMGNAVTAIETCKALELDEKSIQTGIQTAKVPARMELLAPNILLDGAHNPHGAAALAETLKTYFGNRKIHAVVGMMQDKDWENSLSEIFPLCETVTATTPKIDRALSAETIAAAFPRADVVQNPVRAVDQVMERLEPGDLMLICGSFYLAGDVREHILQKLQ